MCIEIVCTAVHFDNPSHKFQLETNEMPYVLYSDANHTVVARANKAGEVDIRSTNITGEAGYFVPAMCTVDEYGQVRWTSSNHNNSKGQIIVRYRIVLVGESQRFALVPIRPVQPYKQDNTQIK